jgi:hypothetical protein
MLILAASASATLQSQSILRRDSPWPLGSSRSWSVPDPLCQSMLPHFDPLSALGNWNLTGSAMSCRPVFFERLHWILTSLKMWISNMPQRRWQSHLQGNDDLSLSIWQFAFRESIRFCNPRNGRHSSLHLFLDEDHSPAFVSGSVNLKDMIWLRSDFTQTESKPRCVSKRQNQSYM